MNKNQKGFTLVELIVVMALMAIIMGAVMAIMSPRRNFIIRLKTPQIRKLFVLLWVTQ